MKMALENFQTLVGRKPIDNNNDDGDDDDNNRLYHFVDACVRRTSDSRYWRRYWYSIGVFQYQQCDTTKPCPYT